MSCYLYIPLVGCCKNRYQNGSFIHTPNEAHSTNSSMWAFNSYGSKISTHDSLHAKFDYHIFKTAGNMKHAKQLGNQYPSWTRTRHILVVFFTYITLSNGYSVRTKYLQYVMLWAFRGFGRTERRHNRYFINMHNEGLHLQQNRWSGGRY